MINHLFPNNIFIVGVKISQVFLSKLLGLSATVAPLRFIVWLTVYAWISLIGLCCMCVLLYHTSSAHFLTSRIFRWLVFHSHLICMQKETVNITVITASDTTGVTLVHKHTLIGTIGTSSSRGWLNHMLCIHKDQDDFRLNMRHYPPKMVSLREKRHV